MWNFLKHGTRAVWRSPRFSLTIILVTGATIAMATTAWLLLQQVVFKPLPFQSPDRLVAVWESLPELGREKSRVSAANYLAWREGTTAFDEMAVLGYSQATLLGHGEPLALHGAEVTSEFFSVLGVRPAIGRLLDESDFRPESPDVVVLSHTLWAGAFHRDPSIVGTTIRLDESQYDVVGVLPDIPIPMTAWASGRLEMKPGAEFYWRPRRDLGDDNFSHVLGVIARLDPESSVQSARAQVEEIAAVLAREQPDSNEGVGVVVVPLSAEAAPPLLRRALWMVAAGAMLLVLLACANIANLYLLRALERQRTLAIRAALGSSNLELWKLLFEELLVLSVLGALVSVPVSALLSSAVQSIPSLDVPQWAPTGFQPQVFVTAGLISVVFALIGSAAPLVLLRRMSLESLLRSRGNTAPVLLDRLRQWLVAAEITLAVVLVVGAALLGQSLRRIQSIDPGFDASNVLTVRLDLPAYRYTEISAVQGFWSELREKLDALPMVERAGGVYDLPIETNWLQSFSIVGEADPANGSRAALFRTVTPGAVEAIGMRLVRGRSFSESDRADAPGVAIVNESFVREFFHDRDPMERELDVYTTQWQWGKNAIPRQFRIVGIVGDVSFNGLTGGSAPAFYLPHPQTLHLEMHLVVHTRSVPSAAIARIRKVVHELDPELPVVQMRSLSDVVEESIARPRLYSQLIGGFSLVAAFLAMLGLATVLNHSLREQQKNLGIRAALGATRQQIFASGLASGLRPVVIGLGVGLLLAAFSSRTLQSLLFELEPLNPLTYIVVALVVLAVTLAVCVAPSLRASRIDPMRVLREE